MVLVCFRQKCFKNCNKKRSLGAGHKRKLLFLFVIAIVCFLQIDLVRVPNNGEEYIRIFPGNRTIRDGEKKILIWKPFISDKVIKNMQLGLQSCPERCTVTDDIRRIANVDAVIFNLYNLWKLPWKIGSKSKIPMPLYRHPSQVWAVFNMEPPYKLWGDLSMFNRVFNWTVWYRKDATIWNPYGGCQALNKQEMLQAQKMYIESDFFSTKRKEVVGRISNCRDPAHRYKLVHELEKDLDVEMFGKCYNHPCGDPDVESDTKCNNDLTKYKFYLAFENSHCKDYVTEKYWWALDREQIPIVNWRGMNPTIPIPGSFINVYDFPDVKTAAKFIKQVGTNRMLYNSYFSWKLKYKNARLPAICSFCQKLHDSSLPLQMYEDLDGWVKKDMCPKLTVTRQKYQIHNL